MLNAKYWNRSLLGLLLLFSLPAARADVMILVHGYLGNAQTWDFNGVMPVLESNGWRRGGYLLGNTLLPPAPRQAVIAQGKRIYLAELPSEAPLLVQAGILRQALENLPTQAGEKRILVGHSAGGVVARLMLLQQGAPQFDALVTIAAPHLGTYRAEQALDLVSVPFPLSIIPDFVGGEDTYLLRRSSGLLVDLVRPFPGTLLFWANALPHPDIAYYSIVRGNAIVLHGDWLVPGPSQDMNNVPSLRGKAKTLVVSSDHGLTPQDGIALIGIVPHL